MARDANPCYWRGAGAMGEAGRGRRASGAGRGARGWAIILEVRRGLELVLGPRDLEVHSGWIIRTRGARPAGPAGAGRSGSLMMGNGVEGAHVNGDVLLADAQKAAHAHNKPVDLAVLVEQQIGDLADVHVV